MKPVFIDVDTGVDDALALLFALQSPLLDVIGISTVSGNVHVDHTYRNTLAVLDIAQAPDIPVARGMDAPLIRPLHTAAEIHGESGFGDIQLPEVVRNGVEEHGVDLMIRKVKESPEPVTLILLGPLTNMAVALKKEPSIQDNIRELVIMGGAGAKGGNVTPVAEFNIYVDPDAAHVVFSSGLPIRLVTWDVCMQAVLHPEENMQLKETQTPVAQYAYRLIQFLRDNNDETFLCDPSAVCAVIDESVIQTEVLPVEVETQEGLTRGMTIIDVRPFLQVDPADPRPKLQVAMNIERERFSQLFIQTLLQQG
ncbi:purine nucleosidase/pyrimidine-specific ribonucleoside hydrolase [Seinonella peptonophila]|uniref:Purine nucleosidase/pyrimidine-specific ribonucleoside hydrolase n=1 Tax=Seinonella peptonophila TaxID=112248 RepID=A0A1M5A6K5_9BACL|nr:nucleoside hydrolase [Seinonella peptonophila]SHF25656.1 purine nucleosidase/pyrimidine-specific ribonucleoside hydrolase [Seinonella peptonophila]